MFGMSSQNSFGRLDSQNSMLGSGKVPPLGNLDTIKTKKNVN
jgi:hypothetical protein